MRRSHPLALEVDGYQERARTKGEGVKGQGREGEAACLQGVEVTGKIERNSVTITNALGKGRKLQRSRGGSPSRELARLTGFYLLIGEMVAVILLADPHSFPGNLN